MSLEGNFPEYIKKKIFSRKFSVLAGYSNEFSPFCRCMITYGKVFVLFFSVRIFIRKCFGISLPLFCIVCARISSFIYISGIIVRSWGRGSSSVMRSACFNRADVNFFVCTTSASLMVSRKISWYSFANNTSCLRYVWYAVSFFIRWLSSCVSSMVTCFCFGVNVSIFASVFLL